MQIIHNINKHWIRPRSQEAQNSSCALNWCWLHIELRQKSNQWHETATSRMRSFVKSLIRLAAFDWLSSKHDWLYINWFFFISIFYQCPQYILVLYKSLINHIGNTGIWLEAWKLFCINFNYKRAVLSFLWPGPQLLTSN